MALQNFYPAAVDAVDLSLLLLSNIIQILTGLSQVRNEVFLKLKRGSLWSEWFLFHKTFLTMFGPPCLVRWPPSARLSTYLQLTSASANCSFYFHFIINQGESQKKIIISTQKARREKIGFSFKQMFTSTDCSNSQYL